MQHQGPAGHRAPLNHKRETVMEPPSEGKVEALAGMSLMLREESPEVIDMRESWIEGPKGKKVCERGSETSGEADDLCSTCAYR